MSEQRLPHSGPDDVLPENQCAVPGRVFFESPAAFSEAFAGDVSGNLRHASQRLGVQLISRDVWVAVSGTENPAVSDRVNRCIAELKRLSGELGRALDQSEFDLVLDAWSEGHESDLKVCFAERIKVGPGKPDVSARSRNQLAYVRAMREKDLVFGVGPAGTGKTYLAMAMAVSCLLEEKVRRIVLTRPAVEAGENLGFLPGTLQDKINPYLRPLHDAMREMMDYQQVEELIARNVIEVAPLAFMRGRTLNHSFVILDEAQNTTREQMLMFLTRLGFHSRCVVCGDPSQIDLPHGHSGLLRALDYLADIPELSICRFDAGDVVRHPLVEKIIRAYRANEKEAD